MGKQGVGASIARKEDDRFLRGRGEYVGDIRLPGMRDVAFVRSPLAHARIKDIRIPAHLRGSVFIASDIAADTRPIRAVSGMPGRIRESGGSIGMVLVLLALFGSQVRGESSDEGWETRELVSAGEGFSCGGAEGR